MNEDNYQCSCGLCFFARETNLIEEHHKLTSHRKGKIRTVESIMNDCLKTISTTKIIKCEDSLKYVRVDHAK